MPRKTTDSNLTPQQMAVLEALLSGSSVTDAAQSNGVDRTTVHRWLRGDHEFKAAYNGGLTDLRDAAQARLLSLASTALEVVSRALDEGDVKTAIGVLRGVGLLSGYVTSIGPSNPRAVAERAAMDEILGL